MQTIIATNLPRFMPCNGSRLMAASAPQIISNSADRDEGIAAHYMAKTVFDGEFSIEELVDRKAPNGFYMSSEMADHVAGYLSNIQPGEMEIDTSYGSEHFRVNGRADHIYYSEDTLYIDEFKYGWSPIEPERNWTLISHAIGYCVIRQIKPKAIILTVHQPRPAHRLGKTRSWSLDYFELLGYYQQIATALTNPSDMLNTGPHCRRCDALATCPAARAASYNAIDASEVVFNDEIGNDALAYDLDALRLARDTIKHRLEALEELAAHRLRNGQVIPDYATEPQYGHRRFKPGWTAAMIQAVTGIDAAKPGIVTPAEFKRRGASEILLSAVTDVPMTGLKLVKISADQRARKALGK